jgi:hypothetical protein
MATKRYFYWDDTTNSVINWVVKFDPSAPMGKSDVFIEMPYDPVSKVIAHVKETWKPVPFEDLSPYTEASEEEWEDFIPAGASKGVRQGKPPLYPF